ncbi:MAG: PspA/IM30 family protein [Gemmatimonadota bacterium]|nr:MAG: PspA/IM30 family protein [Gemmatimonadota bacterium]
MSIWSRLSTMIRSNLNDLIARAENPEKMLNQIIDDMRSQLAQAKQEVAVAIADERKLRRQVQDERDQSADWERRAKLALREGREDLARQALLRSQEHGGHAGTLEDQWRGHASETEKLKDTLRQLSSKIEEAKRKRNLLIARQKRAEAQKRIHETMAGLADRSSFEAFERMAERIEEAEMRALAAAEVDEELGGDELEQQFARLEGGDIDVERRLTALKEEMGLLPAAGAESEVAPDEVREAEIIEEEGAEEEEAG